MQQPKNIFSARSRDHPLPQENEEIREVLSHVDKPLLVIHSVFPFDLFPDCLSINPIEVVFIHNMFFFSSYEMSMPVADIGDISLSKAPFFATLKILPNSFIKDEPIKIEWLTWKDAVKAHDLLQGLITLKKQKVDIAKLSADENEVDKIINVGKPREGS